jgi:TPR repeat protein
MVRGEQVRALTLTLGKTPAGDYPIEVYVLQSGDGPQARRNFVLRIEPPAQAYTAAAAADWASGLLNVVPSAHAAEPAAAPADSGVLYGRARGLLGIGDIAGARLLLRHLAERGDSEAAYELARTFDRETLAELGARGLDGDPAQARGWYQLASQAGNAKATERLKILASLSGTGPSD